MNAIEPMKFDRIILQLRGEEPVSLDCAKPTMATAALPFLQIGDKLMVATEQTTWWQPDSLAGVYQVYDRVFTFGYFIELIIYIEPSHFSTPIS